MTTMKQTYRTRFPLGVLLGLFCLAAVTAVPASASLGFVLDTGPCEFSGDDTLTVYVTVDGTVSDLQGFQLRYTYDQTALEVVSLALGDLVTGSCSFFPALLSSDQGLIRADAAGLGCSVAGPGNILEIKFRGLVPKATQLHCVSSVLRDSGNQPITHTCPDQGIGYEVPQVELIPAQNTVGLGAVVDLEVTVAADCDSFNAYEMTVEYEPAYLSFIELTPAQQEGPLMTGACGLRFHDFGESGGVITLTHGLLCAGVTTSGPGIVYRLRFQTGSVPAITSVKIREFRFAESGLELPVPLTADAVFYIGNTVGLPSDPETGRLQPTLSPAYPNPFTTSVQIGFTLSREGAAQVEIFSVGGRLLRMLWDGNAPAGERRTLVWDGKDGAGRPVTAGMYWARLTTPGAVRATRFFKIR